MNRGSNNLRRNPNKSLSTETRLYGYIQRGVSSDDGRGGESIAWENTTTNPLAFALLPLSAKQVMDFKSINVEASHMVKVRGEIDILEDDRLFIKNRVFKVLTVEDIQEKGRLKIATCKERRS
jgi:head-tail adaptor